MEDEKSATNVKKSESSPGLSPRDVTRKLIRLKMASEMTDIPERTLREMCQRREVEHVRVGARYYFRPAQIEKMIERRTVNVRPVDDRYGRRGRGRSI